MKLLLQKELYGSEWHHVEAANISESLKLFKLSRNQSKDHNEYIDIENNEATGVTKDFHSTLKNRRKHQRLTRDEKQLIFKKSKIEKMNVREICSELHICKNTILQVLREFQSGDTRWNKWKIITYRHLKSSPKIIKEISKFCKECRKPFITKDVISFVNDVLKIDISTHVI